LEGQTQRRGDKLPERLPSYVQVCQRLAVAEDMLVAGDKEQAGFHLALAQAGAMAVMTETLIIAAESLLQMEKRMDELTGVQGAPRVKLADWPHREA
jgi:hypothetical protein